MRALCFCLGILFVTSCASVVTSKPVVLTTDFGLKDGAVSAMKGVAYGVDSRLVVSDLTHEIPPYQIWDGAYRLVQTYRYWPPGTVFVTVVDPGVGSKRRSVVARSTSGHIFVNPDNGLLTMLQDDPGLVEVRLIDESRHRLKGSEESYTFHGRDLYVYVGARLSSGQIRMEEIGDLLEGDLVRLPVVPPRALGAEVQGMVVALDANYGNVWTNIPKAMIKSKGLHHVKLTHNGKVIYSGQVPLVNTFAGVGQGQPLLYFNSLLKLSLALNQGNFAQKFRVGYGPGWSLLVRPL